MWLVLAGLALAACGAATPVAVANRGEPASTSCDLPTRLEFEARRYAMVDADHPDYRAWTAWRVGLQLRGGPRGTLAMVGDELTWTFEVRGTHRGCALELHTDTHEPFTVTIDLRARTGRIRAIDDEWLLGPPFPHR